MNKFNSVVNILVGLPGAGKSTLCTSLYPSYVRINQDLLGNRNDCINVMRMNLKEGKSVIIDRTNISKVQRKYFIDVAKELGISNIYALYLNIPKEDCIARIEKRDSHPNLTNNTPYDKIVEIVEKFEKDLEVPSVEEGFNVVTILTMDDIHFLNECKCADKCL